MSARQLLVSLALSSMAAVNAQSISDLAVRDETIHMSREEPAMRKAFARAAQSLPDFLSLAAKPKQGTSSYALKVAVSDGKNTEYFWVNEFTNQGDAFSGRLNNEPRMVKKYKLGERFAFHRTQIADWTYIDEAGNKTVGNFTACALLSKQPPDQAAAFMRQYGLSCEQ
jgi:uncharacterized protein YegJ (DUF2314 family)